MTSPLHPSDSESEERYDEHACAVIDSLRQIGSQWRLIVLHDLQDEEKRFNELKRSTGANSRTLSRVLDDLQETNLVERRLEPDAPIAAYYRLTEKGRSLQPVFAEIGTWAANGSRGRTRSAFDALAFADRSALSARAVEPVSVPGVFSVTGVAIRARVCSAFDYLIEALGIELLAKARRRLDTHRKSFP